MVQNPCQARSQLQAERRGRALQSPWTKEEIASEKFYRIHPKGEHTTTTLGSFTRTGPAAALLCVFLSAMEVIFPGKTDGYLDAGNDRK